MVENSARNDCHGSHPPAGRVERIRLRIDPDAVYAPIPGHAAVPPANLHLHLSATNLVLARIDGIAPVASIIRTSCLTTYKTYEAITALLAEKRIRPIEHRSFRPLFLFRGPWERRYRKTPVSHRTIFSLLLAGGTILSTIFIGFIIHGFFLSDLEIREARARLEIPVAEAALKVEIASFRFDALKGTSPSLTDLRRVGLLTSADLRPLYEIRALRSSSGSFRVTR